MALEKRGGNYYYYKKEREGNQIVSKYYGNGELALIVAQLDSLERQEKAEKAEIQRKNKEREAKIDRQLSELEQKTKFLIVEFLKGKGFYQTASREWRMKTDER